MAEKVTRMLIKADLQCPRCYRKIKKVLCNYPQIQGQIYDEKQNTVLITVVCCSPEKIRQMIICEGGETVQSIEILLDKPNGENDKQKDNSKCTVVSVEPPKEKPKTLALTLALAPAQPPKAPKPAPMVCYPLVPVYPMVGVCCCPPGYRGYGGGPCYCGQRRPVMCYDGCGRPVGECQGGNKGSFPVLGRPVTCDDGCGRPVGECRGRNSGSLLGQSRPVTCDDGCGRPVGECQGGNRGPGGCGDSFPGHGRPVTCDDGCGRPVGECQGGNRVSFPGQRRLLTCNDGCGRPAGECPSGNRGSFPSQGRLVICDDGCGRPACECQGGNSGYCASRCDYFSEENAAACTVM